MPRILYWIKTLYTHWQNDRIASLAASLAYYTLFSLAPILLICIWIAGPLFGEETAQNHIFAQTSSLLGSETALKIQEIVRNVNHHSSTSVMKVISIIILIFTSSGAFSEIQQGLNTIWQASPDNHKSWFAFIKHRFLSFAMVLISAFLLLISLIISAFLTLLANHITHFLGVSVYFELIINYAFSFLLITLLFAMMFKYLPDINLRWSHVWVGALITSLLFVLGKILINFYLSKAHVASIFGGGGSLIILLIWVYYSAQIFFIGAEITKINYFKKKDQDLFE